MFTLRGWTGVALASVVCLVCASAGRAAVVISDGFTLDGATRVAGANIIGVTTEVGGVNWGGGGNLDAAWTFTANGTVTNSGVRTAAVPYTVTADATVSVDVNFSGYTGTNYAMVGMDDSLPTLTYSWPIWLFVRGNGEWALRASGTTLATGTGLGASSGWHTLKLQYDPATSKATAWYDTMVLASNVSVPTLPTLRYLGFSSSVPNVAADNFVVDVVLPGPPTAVTNLAVGSPDWYKIDLTWTAPSAVPTATVASYDLRYSTSPITDDASFAAATPAPSLPAPEAPGSAESYTLTGLTPSTTYYFAIKSTDAGGVVGPLSNVPSATTSPADTAAPAAVSDLTPSVLRRNYVTLTWMAVGDDGLTGQSAAYDLRYSTAPISDEASFAAATPVTGLPAPKVSGGAETFSVLGLLPGTTYYFAIKVRDEVPNWSPVSNVATATTLLDDPVPTRVSDLAAPTAGIGRTSIQLIWTATGDDGSAGTAARYDLRYSTVAISNSADFAAATPVTGVAAPKAAGQAESFIVTGLTFGTTYHFALVVYDWSDQPSDLSNIATASTGDMPPAAITDLAAPSLAVTRTSIQLNWTATGEDAYDGTAAGYDLRYSTSPISDMAHFSNATPLSGMPAPKAAGQAESFTVTYLASGTTYYFALVVLDAANQPSGLSNIATATTRRNDDINSTLMAIPANTALDLGLFEPEQPAGGSSARSVTDFSGFAYDPLGHQMLLFGGGHSATHTDAVYSFNFETLTWDALYTPVPYAFYKAENYDPTYVAWINRTNPPMTPLARHTYDSLVVPGMRGTLLMFSRGSASGYGVGAAVMGSGYVTSAYLPEYNTATRTWRWINDGPTFAPSASSGAAASEYDPLSGKVIVINGSGLWTYDPDTTKTTAVLSYSKEMGYSNNVVYFPPNQKMYYMARGTPGRVFEVTLDRTNWSNSTVVEVTGMIGTPDWPYETNSGWAYDSVNRVIGGSVTDGQFRAYDPLTKTWTTTTMIPSSAQGNTIGTTRFQALNYDPVDGVYIFIATGSGGAHTWAYRHAAHEDATPPPAPQNVQAVAASPTSIQLTWSAPSDPESGIAYYKVYRDGLIIAPYVANAFYADINLREATAHTYEVSAVNRALLESARSEPVSAATLPDTTPPTIAGVNASGWTTLVHVIFSEPVDPASALNPANYVIDSPTTVAVTAASLGADGKTVTLTTAELSEGMTYTLTVSNVLDCAQAPNAIASGTQAQFTFITTVTLVDFGPSAGTDVYGLAGWQTTIKDTYTANNPGGPGGTTVTIADSAAGYNFQGVTAAAPRTFVVGEKIIVTWYNNHATETYTLTPKVSFDDPNRASTSPGLWQRMTSITLAPGQSGKTEYTFDGVNAGNWSIVNVNVNFTFSSANAMICDKIELQGLLPPDIFPPAAVTTLQALATDNREDSVDLTWTATGDDGAVGQATVYDLRYSTSEITESNFATATQVFGLPAPNVAGQAEAFQVAGLAPGTLYYFAMKVADDVNNISGLSNVASVQTRAGIPPATITDLAAGGVGPYQATLTWTAVGEDGTIGQAALYDLRYSTSEITEANFASATQATGLPAPKLAGQQESFTILNLSHNTTYYVAIKTRDNRSNWSALSNVPSFTTGPQDILAPEAITTLAAQVKGTLVILTWLTPADIGGANLAGYDVRYSTGPIDESNFSAATAAAVSAPILAAGELVTVRVRGLQPTTHYYFAVKSRDRAPVANVSALSNVVEADTGLTVAPLVIRNPWIVNSRVADVRTMQTLGATFGKAYTPDGVIVPDPADIQTQAINEYNNFKRRMYHWGEMPPDNRDTIEQMNVFGWALCGSHAAMNSAILLQMGLSPRTIYISGGDHTYYEVFYNNRWHALDTMTTFYVYDRSNPPQIASVADVQVDKSLVLSALAEGRACPGFLLCGDTDTGFANGADDWAVLSTPGASTSDLSMNMDLRLGESFDRTCGSWITQHVNTNPPYHHESQHDWKDTVNIPYWEPYMLNTAGNAAIGITKGATYRRWANGIYTLAPDFTSAGYQASLASSTNIATFHDDGLTPDLHVAATEASASAVFRIATPFYLTDLNIDGTFVRATANDVNRIQVSTTSATSGFATVWENAATGTTQLTALNARTQVYGKRQLWVKIELQAAAHKADAGVSDLVITPIFEHNKGGMAYLDKGLNTITVTFDNPQDLNASVQFKVIYKWQEYNGSAWTIDRQAERVITGSPYTFTIEVGGTKVPRTESIRLEVVQAPPPDPYAPAEVTDLAAITAEDTKITLGWTATGDDGVVGQASNYDLRCSTLPISEANWNAATVVTDVPAPRQAGQAEQFTVTGLQPETTYYFALKVRDEGNNSSGLSNVASATTTEADTTPPNWVGDLIARPAKTANQINLTWTAPADYGVGGAGPFAAKGYQLRYSTSHIDEASWSAATPIAGLSAPKSPGSAEAFTVTGLTGGTLYYFALKSVDEFSISEISNTTYATAPLLGDKILQRGQGGYTGVSDSYLTISSNTYGSSTRITLCGYADLGIEEVSRGLIRFELSDLPAGSTFSKATLYLYSYDVGQRKGSTGYYGLYPVTRDWLENAANWTKATSNVNWTAAGGDFAATPHALSPKQGTAPTWYTWDVTDCVRDWIADPSTNKGWVIKCTDENLHNQDYFYSSDASAAEYRPKLVFSLAAPVVGDVTDDGHVDVVDLLFLVDSFGRGLGERGYDPKCDFNADNIVDVVDLLTFVENWGL
jgi:hypothetical protein